MKYRVCDIFDYLKPGMFVKTRADGNMSEIHHIEIIGEIGLLGKNEFFILTNYIGNDKTNEVTKHYAKTKGYEYVWYVGNKNKNLIEILDKLPEDQEDDEDEEDCNEENKCNKCKHKEHCIYKDFKQKIDKFNNKIRKILEEAKHD